MGLSLGNDSNKIDVSVLSNDYPMSAGRTDKVVSEHVAYTADLAVLAAATAMGSKVYDNDTLKTGPFIRWYKTVTTLSGSATYYPTADGTSTGTALFAEIFSNSVQTQTQDGTSVYAPGTVTVAGNLKSVAVAYTKQVFSGIVLLSTNLLGSVTNSAIPDGVSIRAGFEGI